MAVEHVVTESQESVTHIVTSESPVVVERVTQPVASRVIEVKTAPPAPEPEPEDVVERIATPVTSRVVEVRSAGLSEYLRRVDLDDAEGTASTVSLNRERNERRTEDSTIRADLGNMQTQIEALDNEKQSHTHYQSIPDSTWTISHGLGFYPNVTALDSAGTVMFGADVEYPSVNAVVLRFGNAFGGTAYLS